MSKSTTPNRYQQWVAGGKKYHKGLSLFNEVQGFSTLKKTLERGPSPYNNAKLDAALQRAFDAPAKAGAPHQEKAHTKAQGKRMNGHTHRQEQRVSDPPPPPAKEADTGTDEGADGDSAGGDGDGETPASAGDDDPRDEPTEYTPRKWKAKPFSQLPEPLKKLRISIIADYRERSIKHAELVAHPPKKEHRELLCRAIVELTDRINAHWAMEETWTKGGGLPHLPEDEEQRIATADVFQLQRELANQVVHQLKRINSKLKKDLDEEERTALEMRKGALEHTKALIKARLLTYQQQVKA